MKKNTKRVLAMLLCLMMCVSLLPIPVLAEKGMIIADELGGIIGIAEEESAKGTEV